MDIGIDLGTTYSVIAVDGKVDLAPDYPGGAGYYLDQCDVTIIPSPVGEYTFPSVMIPDPEDQTRWFFGADAVQNADEGLAPVMFSKRKIGTTELIPVATGTVTAREVAARFLQYLKQSAESALGQTVARAVVTHPAYFDRGAVEETRAAARDAGFDMALPQQMLMEPVAAALCYTRADARDPLRILTYDLGGGTFDVTYMERREGVISVHAFDGDHLLGGYNFDLALVHAMLARLEKNGRTIVLDQDNPEDRIRVTNLLRLAENAKIKLSNVKSDSDAVEFRALNALVDNRRRPVQINERFTRTQFVAAIQGYLDEVLACCRRVLEKGKVSMDDLHEILLVGGSSRGPWIMASLKKAFPKTTPQLFEPDLCVGAGAAIHARMALPRNLESEQDVSAEYRVTLDAPESTLLEEVHVAGQVVRKKDNLPPMEKLIVTLSPAEGSAPVPLLLTADGRFLFQNVELSEQSENRFVLRLKNSTNMVVYKQSFSVLQGRTQGVVTTTTVLPRPLYIETARGLVALAEEGVTLPAKCVAEFERSNANANMELRLFQEQDQVGLVRIKDIPREAGEGSPVVLTLEITADNQVIGDVAIYTLIMDKNGKEAERKEALRGKIDISFDPAVIPFREELEDQFQSALVRLDVLSEREPDFAEEISGEAIPFVTKIEHMFAQPILERQEAHVALRKLRNLMVLPKDEMSPTRLQFKGKVRKCREAMDVLKLELLERIESLDDETGQNHTKEKARYEKAVQKLSELEKKIETVKQKGLEAHMHRNRSAWENSQAALAKIDTQIDQIKNIIHAEARVVKDHFKGLMEQEPFLLKILVLEQEIRPLKALLGRHVSAIQRKSTLSTWHDELEEIDMQLDAAANKVLAIDDKSEPTQIRAKIQVVLQSINGLKLRIDCIGKDLA